MSRLPSQEEKRAGNIHRAPPVLPAPHIPCLLQSESLDWERECGDGQPGSPAAAGHQLCDFRRVSELMELPGMV